MGTSLFDQEPSAITNMMGLLSQTPPSMQGQQSPAPVAPVGPSQMPQFAPPPGPPPAQPSLVDRVHHRLQGLLDSVRPSDPTAGYGGILSPDQIEAAKPGRVESLIERVAGLGSDIFTKQAYQQNLDRAAKMQEIATQVAEQRRIQGVRQSVAANPDFQPQPGETDSQRHNRLERIGVQLAQQGDYAGAKSVGDILKDLKDKRFQVAGADLFDLEGPNGPTLLNPHEHNPVVGSQEWKDAEAYKASLRPRGGANGEPIVKIEGPNGPVYVPRSQAIGQPPATTPPSDNPTAAAAKARLTAAVSEMNNAHSAMTQYEQGLKDGSIKIGAPAQLLQRIANSFTHDDPVSMTLQSASLAALDKADPALARYIRRGLSFAEGESMISQRPSDFRTKMAAFLSTAASGASPDMVNDIESRRNSIMTPLNASVTPSTPKGSGSASGVKGKRTYTYKGQTYTY